MFCNTGCFSQLDHILTEYSGVKGSLVTILQKAQEIYGYLPQDVIKHIAEATGIKPAKVFGVVTFYTQFRLEPVGKYLIQLCQGTACHVEGSGSIEKEILSLLPDTSQTAQEDEAAARQEGEASPAAGLFTLHNVACLGCCSLAPVMTINGETHGMLTPEKARQVLQDIIDQEV